MQTNCVTLSLHRFLKLAYLWKVLLLHKTAREVFVVGFSLLFDQLCKISAKLLPSETKIPTYTRPNVNEKKQEIDKSK